MPALFSLTRDQHDCRIRDLLHDFEGHGAAKTDLNLIGEQPVPKQRRSFNDIDPLVRCENKQQTNSASLHLDRHVSISRSK